MFKCCHDFENEVYVKMGYPCLDLSDKHIFKNTYCSGSLVHNNESSTKLG